MEPAKKRGRSTSVLVQAPRSRSMSVVRVSQPFQGRPNSQSSVSKFQKKKGSKEYKNFDLGGPATIAIGFGAATWSALTLMNNMIVGTTPNTRVGRKVLNTKYMLRWQAALAATTTGGAAVRIRIIFDKNINAAAAVPAATDLFTVNHFLGPNNLVFSDRFITLYDGVTDTIGPASTFVTSGVITVPMRLETVYTGTAAGNTTDVASGAIFLTISNTGNLAVADGVFSYISRLRYLDD